MSEPPEYYIQSILRQARSLRYSNQTTWHDYERLKKELQRVGAYGMEIKLAQELGL